MPSSVPANATLQILATTDLHMQILPYDYLSDQPDLQAGLLQLADDITARQADQTALTLLFDNGDFLQGNPLADTVAQAAGRRDVHPVMQSFAELRYDAIGLGNHEFNYGLPFLRRVVQDCACPVVCTNIDWRDETACAQPFALLDRQIRCHDGRTLGIRIGVLGFVPPQVTDWDRVILRDAIATCDIVSAARAVIPQIKAAGADLVVALCHTGIGADDHVAGMENAAVPLARLDGIDVVLTGHTHDLFPDTARPPAAQIDPVLGRLHGKPAVGAGFHGQALGVIRLDLRHDAAGWQVRDSTSAIIPACPHPAQSGASRAITAIMQADHAATLDRIRQPVAQSLAPIHSFFARVSPDLPAQILGTALIDHARAIWAGPDLPVIAAVSPLRAGGRAGPGHYVHIPPGPVTRRDASAIYPYPDTPVLLRQTGQQLRDRLEQAVSGYQRIRPGSAGQPLFHPCFAPYVFDTICGLSYVIDLQAPARHDAAGRIIAPQAQRIHDLRHAGRQVRADDCFVLVTNSYRAFGGGGYPAAAPCDVLHLSDKPVREILTDWLQDQQVINLQPQPNWRFAPIKAASASFCTALLGRPYATPAMIHQGTGPDGLDSYSLTF